VSACAWEDWRAGHELTKKSLCTLDKILLLVVPVSHEYLTIVTGSINIVAGLINRLATSLKLDLLWDKLVGHGLYLHAIRNPDILCHLQKQAERHYADHLATWPFSKGAGIRISGAAHIEYPRGLVVGNNVHIDEGCYLDARGGILIGDNTHISRNVTICSSHPRFEGDALPYDNMQVDKPVTIGKNVWIDMNVTIVPGVIIGEGAVIRVGAVINEDVPALAIVSSAVAVISNTREASRYKQLEQQQRWSGNGGNLLTEKAKSAFNRTAEQLGEKMFFVLGTGRNGSTAIAKNLNRHAGIICQHEPKLSLVTLSTKYSHREVSIEKVKQELMMLYCEQYTFPDLVYGESDQKLSNMVPLLRDILPSAKFIWLLRNPVDTINSTFSRGWFLDNDLYPTQVQRETYTENYKPMYSQYRVHADKAGLMSEQEWKDMSPFARNCWYWSYWNEMIEAHLKTLPVGQSMLVRLEDLQFQMPEILRFLGLPYDVSLEVQQANQAVYKLLTQSDWSADMQADFDRICLPNYRRWYDLE
jgi:acetyltransferase-like isoleucine patch superfamily enzyme